MKLIDGQLLKCLQCRLAGSPPKFSLPPPPPPPAFIDNLFSGATSDNNKFDLTNFNNNKIIRRCLRLKAMLKPTTQTGTNISPSPSIDNDVSIEQSRPTSPLFDLSSTDSLYLFFFICAVLFIAVLVVALVFLYKLFKIKKHINKSQSDSQISKSTFLTNSSTVSSSNTINSQLSSLKESDSQLYNQLFNHHQRINNQYFPAQATTANSNSNEDYTEISSQVYLDTGYLEKLKQSCHNMALLGQFNEAQAVRTSGSYLVTNGHLNAGGLIFVNQFPIQQQLQNGVQNMYYVC